MRRPLSSSSKLLIGTIVVGVGIVIAGGLLSPRLQQEAGPRPELMPFSSLAKLLVQDTAGGMQDVVTIESDRVVATTSSGLKTAWTGDSDVPRDLSDRFKEAGQPFAKLQVQYEQPPSSASRIIWYLLPVLLLIAVMAYATRQAGAMNGRAFGFGKNRAKRFEASKSTTSLADVAGVDEAKQELAEVVEFLKSPERFAGLGARIPHGVLLVGPPGTGKTLLSRAVAGEANVPFFHMSGSEFVEMFVGVGAARVRDLFAEAKKVAPCIIFVDEIDAVGRKRGSGPGGGAHEEREQTLNQILVEMDGFNSDTNVIVIAATNRADVLDPALLRPGRFDRQVTLDAPDVRGRKAILQVHASGKPLDGAVDLDVIAKQTPGFSGADLANVLNEAAILAGRDHQTSISMRQLEESVDRVVGGPARKSRVMSSQEKAITAYHEAGHAVVGRSLPNCDPVHKVSIVSRGRMGGYTRFLPAEDRNYYRKTEFIDNLACLLGGMAAEELIFGESSTGPQNDLQRATDIARSMVTDYGMSGVGPVTYGNREQVVFRGGEASSQHNYSDATAEAIDREVHGLVSQAQAVARETLIVNRDRLERVARRLIEDETLNAAQFEALYEDRGLYVPPVAPTPMREPEAEPEPVPVVAERPRRRARVALAAATEAARDPFAKGRAAALRRLTPKPMRPGFLDEDSFDAGPIQG